jgi:hypothetical protein
MRNYEVEITSLLRTRPALKEEEICSRAMQAAAAFWERVINEKEISAALRRAAQENYRLLSGRVK